MRWISVKDRLPEPGSYVLVFTDDRDTYTALYYVCGYENHGHWMVIDRPSRFYKIAHKVTHWMPLPKPPEDCDNDAEDIEHEPVIHANWILIQNVGFFHNRVVKCSHCGNILDMGGVNAGRGDANFCPNCGAKMDG